MIFRAGSIPANDTSAASEGQALTRRRNGPEVSASQILELGRVSRAGAKGVLRRLRADPMLVELLKFLDNHQLHLDGMLQLAWIEGYKAGLAATLPPHPRA